MEEKLRENYFLVVRIGLLLILEGYIVLSQSVLTGASGRVLLLLALFIGVMSGQELINSEKKWIFLILAIMLWAFMMSMLGREFVVLGILLCYEILTFIKPNFLWYYIPVMMAFIPSEIGIYIQFLIALFIGIIYMQHDFVIESYKNQTKEDILSEQYLKRNMYEKEHAFKEEIKKQLLEQRVDLSQTLHDKLGHNINGSVYQLEATKLLLEKEPETSKKMIQAVIDELRTGMDEIRIILRKERPKKYELAILQLKKLCEECSRKGVEMKLHTEGALSEVSENYLEIILDNAYEAVSNSLKYAKCTKIEIKIHVMNQLIRCSISDNGIGCDSIVDGMGISGMRRRIREANGIVDFESQAGFTINMLLPR